MVVRRGLKQPCRLVDVPDSSKRQVLFRMREDDASLPFPQLEVGSLFRNLLETRAFQNLQELAGIGLELYRPSFDV